MFRIAINVTTRSSHLSFVILRHWSARFSRHTVDTLRPRPRYVKLAIGTIVSFHAQFRKYAECFRNWSYPQSWRPQNHFLSSHDGYYDMF